MGTFPMGPECTTSTEGKARLSLQGKKGITILFGFCVYILFCAMKELKQAGPV